MGYPRAQAFGYDQRALGTRLRQNQHKLIAAQARRGINSTQLLTKALGQPAQRRVAGVVTYRIVQLLEPVEIEHYQRQRLVRTSGHQQIFIKLRLERTAIVATGQRVGEGLLLNLREQVRVFDSYRNLVGNSAQQ